MNAIMFSRDRAAQCDLALRSLQTYAPWIDKVTVIYKASTPDYRFGYDRLRSYHFGPRFEVEHNFRDQVIGALDGKLTVFLCDDDVFFRPIASLADDPEIVLMHDPGYLCLSLRLGANTTHCYSLDRPQTLRVGGTFLGTRWWRWREATGDLAYPGSVDGHVWRTHQLRTLITESPIEWDSPNELEDALNTACKMSLLPLMVSYEESVLCGVPVNSVQDVYDQNRNATEHRAPLLTLNKGFLLGKRLSLASVKPAEVNSAHVEVKLLWEPPGSLPEIGKKMAADSTVPAPPDPVSFQA